MKIEYGTARRCINPPMAISLAIVISPMMETHGPIKTLSPMCAACFCPLVAPMVTH